MKFVNRAGLRDRGIVFSNVHLLRLERAGKFPKRVHLTPKRVVWVETEISEWAETCVVAARSAKKAST